MSESAPVYIPCASGNDVFSDCMVKVNKRGDLVRLVGISPMDFTVLGARNLAIKILELIGDDMLPKFPDNDVNPLRRARKVGGSFQHSGTLVSEFKTTSGENRVVIEFDEPVKGMLHVYRADQVEILHSPPIPLKSGDEIVDAVRERLLERSIAGQQKYGMKMTRDDLSLKDWIKHALEECLDQAVYLERLGRDVELAEDDGK